jgi:hypothetical protein
LNGTAVIQSAIDHFSKGTSSSQNNTLLFSNEFTLRPLQNSFWNTGDFFFLSEVKTILKKIRFRVRVLVAHLSAQRRCLACSICRRGVGTACNGDSQGILCYLRADRTRIIMPRAQPLIPIHIFCMLDDSVYRSLWYRKLTDCSAGC